jgi:hypothetical protein
MNKKLYVTLVFLCLCFSVSAQKKSDSLQLQFNLKFDHLPLELHKTYSTITKDTLTVNTFKCYVSAIEIEYTDHTLFKERDSYHLLDIEAPNSLVLPLPISNSKTISRILFTVGIDSLTNTSGALDGDLDPTKGMYWAWQSGYINFKIEGKSSSCKTRKNEFQFHIGGYLPPYSSVRRIELRPTKNETIQTITIDLNTFFSKVALAQINQVMIPGKNAIQLADYFAKSFTLE